MDSNPTAHLRGAILTSFVCLQELYVEGAMVTEDTDHSRQPIWKTADHTSDASSMGPRKMAKTGSCDKAVATQLVGQCLLGQDSIMQDAQAADGAR